MSVVTIDSYSESNFSVQSPISGTSGNSKSFAQSFLNSAESLDSAKFYIKKGGTPVSGNIYAKLYASTGTHGSSAIPTGSALATSDAFDTAGLSTSLTLETFSFTGDNKVALVNGTVYCIAIEHNVDGSLVYVGLDNSSPAHSGNWSVTDEQTDVWSSFSSADMCFYVYGEKIPTPIEGNIYALPPFKKA